MGAATGEGASAAAGAGAVAGTRARESPAHSDSTHSLD